MISKSQCFKIMTGSNNPFVESWVISYTLSHLHLTTALVDITLYTLSHLHPTTQPFEVLSPMYRMQTPRGKGWEGNEDGPGTHS